MAANKTSETALQVKLVHKLTALQIDRAFCYPNPTEEALNLYHRIAFWNGVKILSE